MSDGATLNSRLRVLVAKTFRAERFYSAVHNVNQAMVGSISVLTEAANDMRAQEWYKSHHNLRLALNAVLKAGLSAESIGELIALRDKYAGLAADSARRVEVGSALLAVAANKEEFGQSLRMSFELIQHKASAQANRAIAAELSSVLEFAGKSATLQKKLLDSIGSIAPASPAVEKISDSVSSESPEMLPNSNVIPLRRRAAGGRRDCR